MSAPQPILEHSSHVYTLSGKPLVSVSRVIDALVKKSWSDAGVDPERLRKAAERGSLVEQYATELMKTGHVTITTDNDEVLDRLAIFEKWWLRHNPTLIDAQRIVWSEVDGIAGTLDWILNINGQVYLVDCKCTVRPERAWLLQIGAYCSMVEDFIGSAAVLHINPKYDQGYIWREYDPMKAEAYWRKALDWYRCLQDLKAEASE